MTQEIWILGPELSQVLPKISSSYCEERPTQGYTTNPKMAVLGCQTEFLHYVVLPFDHNVTKEHEMIQYL